jgi:hypothetical protein
VAIVALIVLPLRRTREEAFRNERSPRVSDAN